MAVDIVWSDLDPELGSLLPKPPPRTPRTHSEIKRKEGWSEFLSKFTAILSELQAMQQLFRDLQYKYQDSFSAATPQQTEAFKKDLQAKSSQIKNATLALIAHIDQLGQEIRVDERDLGTLQQQQTKVKQIRKQVENFIHRFLEFQTQMRDEQRQECIKKLRNRTGQQPTEEAVNQFIDFGDERQLYASLLQPEDMPGVRQVMSELQERYQSAKALQVSIQEVSELFYQIQALVQRQGEKIDSLVESLRKSQIQIKKAGDNAEGAGVIKTRTARMKLFILVGAAMAVAVIVAVILGIVFGMPHVK